MINVKRGRIFRPRQLPDKARLKLLWARALAPPPPSFDVDAQFTVAIPPLMDCNDALGCCVMAARAEQQRRFYALETNTLLAISDAEIQTEYFSESGGQDTGLEPETSLAQWKQSGWIAGGARRFCDNWARVDNDPLQIQLAIALLTGTQLGFCCPDAWVASAGNGQPWDTDNWTLEPDNGHQVWIKKYDTAAGLAWCETWGFFQPITFSALAVIADPNNQGELEAVVSGSDPNVANAVDIPRLEAELAEIAQAA